MLEGEIDPSGIASRAPLGRMNEAAGSYPDMLFREGANAHRDRVSDAINDHRIWESNKWRGRTMRSKAGTIRGQRGNSTTLGRSPGQAPNNERAAATVISGNDRPCVGIGQVGCSNFPPPCRVAGSHYFGSALQPRKRIRCRAPVRAREGCEPLILSPSATARCSIRSHRSRRMHSRVLALDRPTRSNQPPPPCR